MRARSLKWVRFQQCWWASLGGDGRAERVWAKGWGYHETLPKPRPTGSAAVRGVRRGAGESPMRPSRPRRWGGTVRGATSRGAVGGASADRSAWDRARFVAVTAGSTHEEALKTCHLIFM